MGLYELVLFCLLCLTCFGHSSNKHMICREAGDVFGDVTHNEVHSRHLIGPKGEKGNMGERGFSGSNGLPGKLDYDRVQEIVRLEVEEETRLLRLKMDIMATQIKNLTSQISGTRALGVTEPHTISQTTTQPTTVVRCVEGVIHEGICYWAKFDSSKYGETTYVAAQNICSNKASRLADINGEVHYNIIMNYIRGILDRRSQIYIWTGMRKIYENNIAQLSDGSPAPYTRSRSTWNDAYESYTHVYLLVKNSTNDPDQGMGAYWPTAGVYGALCQTE